MLSLSPPPSYTDDQSRAKFWSGAHNNPPRIWLFKDVRTWSSRWIWFASLRCLALYCHIFNWFISYIIYIIEKARHFILVDDVRRYSEPHRIYAPLKPPWHYIFYRVTQCQQNIFYKFSLLKSLITIIIVTIVLCRWWWYMQCVDWRSSYKFGPPTGTGASLPFTHTLYSISTITIILAQDTE